MKSFAPKCHLHLWKVTPAHWNWFTADEFQQICHIWEQNVFDVAEGWNINRETLRVSVICKDEVCLMIQCFWKWTVYLLMSNKSKQLHTHPLLHSIRSISQSLKIMSHMKTLERIQEFKHKLKSIEVFEWESFRRTDSSLWILNMTSPNHLCVDVSADHNNLIYIHSLKLKLLICLH